MVCTAFYDCGCGLILTYSRSSYLALIGGTSVVIGFLKRWKIGLILILTF